MARRLARVAALACVVTAAGAGVAAALVPSDPQGAHPAYEALRLPAADRA